ncbi:presenilin-1-like [Haemaphysalis longicornis]
MAPERPQTPSHPLRNVLEVGMDDALVHVVKILAAVSCCMLVVIFMVSVNPRFLDNQGTTLPYTPLPDTDEQMPFTRATNATANALILLGTVVVMTVFMVSLYYYRFYKVINAWVGLACATLLILSPLTYIDVIFSTFNLPADHFSVGMFVYNFAALGLVVVLSTGPLVLQQFYLIMESSFMALMLIKYLPAWTVWVVLCLIPIWDLVAVLAAHGPLRILVETAHERKEGLQPGLVFSTMIVGTFPGMASRQQQAPSSAAGPSGHHRGPSSEHRAFDARGELGTSSQGKSDVEHSDRSRSARMPSSVASSVRESYTEEQVVRGPPSEVVVFSPAKQAPKRVDPTARRTQVGIPHGPSPKDDAPRSVPTSEDQERQGIKMGLGDFVFYCVLVGKVATFGDWAIVAACFVGILVGICVTLALLAVTQSALPALPVSLAFGLFFVASQQAVQSFSKVLFLNQVFI